MSERFTSPPLPPPPPGPPPAEPGEPLPIQPEGRPRGRGVALVVGIVGLAIVGLVGWLVFRSTSSPSLALSFEQGQDESFRMHMTMRGTLGGNLADLPADQPFEADMSMTMRWEVLDVDDEGAATIRMSVTDVAGTMNGTLIPSTPATTVLMKIAPDGRLLEAGGMDLSGLQIGGGATGMPGLGQQVTPILPDHEVRPGDAWTKEFTQEMPFGGEEVTIRTENRLLRYEDVDGARAAVIETHMAMPFDLSFDSADLGALEALAGGRGAGTIPDDVAFSYEGDLESDMTSWVDMEAQRLLRSETSADFDMTMTVTGIPDQEVPGGEVTLTFTGTMTQEVERL
jgi:hypothetical protein